MNTETLNTDINTVRTFIRAQMGGETAPSQGSQAEQELSAAVGSLLRRNAPAELELLGTLALQAVIDHMCSGIAASNTLQRFIRGGRHERD